MDRKTGGDFTDSRRRAGLFSKFGDSTGIQQVGNGGDRRRGCERLRLSSATIAAGRSSWFAAQRQPLGAAKLPPFEASA